MRGELTCVHAHRLFTFALAMQSMASTIDDTRARESLLDAIRDGHGSRVAQEACALIAAKKEAVVRKICQECCAMCSPEYCLAMILFLTHRPKSGNKHTSEESAWLADGIATVVSGARASKGCHDGLATGSGSGSGSSSRSGQRNQDKVRKMIVAIEAAAARVRPASRNTDVKTTTRDDQCGAREDSRFSEALGALPAKPGDRWNPVIALVDVAYQHDVVQAPLVRNDKFRKLVLRAKAPKQSMDAPSSIASKAPHREASLRTPANEMANGSNADGSSGGTNVADDPHLKMAALWTFDRSQIPCNGVGDVPIPCAGDLEAPPPPKVVHCSKEPKKGRRRAPKDQVTCFLVEEDQISLG